MILHREHSYAVNLENKKHRFFLNFQIQELINHSVLVQLNDQLFILSRQLLEIEQTNTLQLRIVIRLLSRLIKVI